jgi:hypothetical protein
MFLKLLTVSFLSLGIATSAMAASSSHGGDRGGWGDSPGAEGYETNNTIAGKSDDATAQEQKDPNACWTLQRSADGKSIVPPDPNSTVKPRNCN